MKEEFFPANIRDTRKALEKPLLEEVERKYRRKLFLICLIIFMGIISMCLVLIGYISLKEFNSSILLLCVALIIVGMR